MCNEIADYKYIQGNLCTFFSRDDCSCLLYEYPECRLYSVTKCPGFIPFDLDREGEFVEEDYLTSDGGDYGVA